MFTIVTSLKGATSTEIDLALEAFDQFMNQLTPKHRKRIHYALIMDKPITIDNWASQIDILQTSDLSNLSAQEADLYVCPFEQKPIRAVKKILQLGLPLLGLNSLIKSSTTPKNSMILIPRHPVEHRAKTYAHFMNMLYFDPGAKKVLAKAAKQLAETFQKKTAQNSRLRQASFDI